MSSGEGGLGLGDTRVVVITRQCWGVGDASIVIGEGDARVIVAVVNTLVLG